MINIISLMMVMVAVMVVLMMVMVMLMMVAVVTMMLVVVSAMVVMMVMDGSSDVGDADDNDYYGDCGDDGDVDADFSMHCQ